MPREFRFTRPLVIYAALIVALVGTILGGATAPVDAGIACCKPQTGRRSVLRCPRRKRSLIRVSRFDYAARDLVENLYVGLTRFDPVTQTVEPAAAESWTVSDDGMTWTFTLRDDLQWVRYDSETDEVVAVRPVVAGDFVYSVQRACDPLRPSPITANLMVIRGCQTVAQAFPEVVNDLFIAREIAIRATSPTTRDRASVPDELFPHADQYARLSPHPARASEPFRRVVGEARRDDQRPVCAARPAGTQRHARPQSRVAACLRWKRVGGERHRDDAPRPSIVRLGFAGRRAT